jgi:hypothetical protein
MAVVEIEIDSPQNRSLFFAPIQGVVRGRFDFLRGDRALRAKADDFPAGVAGQRIGYDPERGEGYVVEPLHEPGHADVRRQIEAAGYGLPEPRRAFPGPGDPRYNHADTWLYWMKRAVDAGHAKVVRGKLPAEFKGPVRKNVATSDAHQQRAAQANLTALLVAMLTPDQRARFEAAKAELTAAR